MNTTIILKYLKSKQVLVSVGIVSLLLLITGALYHNKSNRPSIPLNPQEFADVTNDREIPQLNENLELPLSSPSVKPIEKTNHISVLLLGYGGAGHQGGFLSDVILLAYIDVVTKKLALIHIPRDLWVSITVGDTTIPTKINGALALGTKSGNYPTKDLPSDSILRGSYLSKLAIKQVTGLEIDYVIGVDFSGFAAAIDSLKGIEVAVAQTFDDPWYPVKGRELELCGKSPEEVTALSATMSGFTLEKQFPCRYEHLHFAQGKNTMDGATALKFVRSRHSNTYGGDFARGERQSAVLIGVMNKLFSLKALDKIPEFYKLLSKSVKSDISSDIVSSLGPVLKTLPDMKQQSIGLSTQNVLTNGTSKSGAYILQPKAGDGQWDGVHDFVKQELSK